MSTTNTGGTVSGLAPTEPGSPKADDHTGGGAPSTETIARGHEEDRYDAISVLSVPLLVVIFFVLAFTTVSVIFYFIYPSPNDPSVHPQARERNSAPLPERIGRIYRGSKDVDQPRLEPLRMRTGDDRAITRPETPTGNSPELHPEDIRPNATNTPALYRFGWVDANKTVARIALDDAMDILVAKNMLPLSKTPSSPHGSENVPTASNAGRGDGPSRSTPPQVPPVPPGGKN